MGKYVETLSQPSEDVLVDIFVKMTLINLCDERLRSVIKSGRIRAPHYSPRGQEAISAALAVNLLSGDYLLTIYRGLHDHLAKGVPLKELWAEYAGRVTGACKGKGGPMHITHPASGVMVTTGIVGSGIPIANGFAWASLVAGDGRITVTNFGDGASNIGAFHEALNLASLWKLPVIFVCHNNGYAEHTSFANGTAVEHVSDRASSYSMPGVLVDGNDPIALWRTFRAAIDRARRGDGPTLVEAKTFRFEGHNFGDPGKYIPKEEMAEARTRDPMPRFRKWLIDHGVAAEKNLAAIEVELAAELDEAVEFAFSSPYPPPEELDVDVYSERSVA